MSKARQSRQKGAASLDGDGHKVSLSVCFSLSVNKPEKDPYSYEAVKDGESKRIYENLHPDHYFRIQYQLLPSTQSSHVFKTDVVNFGGVVSKVYTDKYSRVIQSWPEAAEEQERSLPKTTNTFSWRHKHRFLANKASLLELHNHVVEVRLWSSSKKVATSTRYDRPKAFKLPSQPLLLEMLKQPTQFVLVSHNPANAMPKLLTTGSDDSCDAQYSAAASTRGNATLSYAATSASDSRTKEASITKDSISSKAEKLVTSTAAEESTLPDELSNVNSTFIPQDVDLSQPSHTQRKRKVPKKVPKNHSQALKQQDTVGASSQQDELNMFDSDYSETLVDSSCSDSEVANQSQRPSKSKGGDSEEGTRGRKTKKSSDPSAENAKKSDAELKKSECSKKPNDSKKLFDSERLGALPSTSNEDQQEAQEHEEFEDVAYSETPPSLYSPIQSPTFVDRSGTPLIRVLLDPDLFPPMDIPSLKCRKGGSFEDEVGSLWPPVYHVIKDGSYEAIHRRLSRSAPSSPVQSRKLKRLHKLKGTTPEFKMLVNFPSTANRSPVKSRQVSSRMRADAVKQLKVRCFSASPTSKNLKKITRELSKILARSIHLSSSRLQVHKKEHSHPSEDDKTKTADVLAMEQEVASSSKKVIGFTDIIPPNSPQQPPKNKAPIDKEREKEQGKGKKDATVAAATTTTTVTNASQRQSEGSGGRREGKERTSAEVKSGARINKEGLVVLRLKLSELFSTKGYVKARLENPIKDVMGFEVGVHLTSHLMPEHLVRELRPMAITVDKVTGLPSNPVSHQDLVNRCEPAFVQYQFPSHAPLRTQGLPQAPSLPFRSCNVILLGNFSDAHFLEFLRGPPLTFELHDRDPREVKPAPRALFGQDSMDDIIGTHMLGAALARGVGGASNWQMSENETKSHSPYGIAKFDLSGFLRGGCELQMTVPVRPSPRTNSQRGPPGSALVPPGNYADANCEMTVTFEIWRPLNVLVPGCMSFKSDLTTSKKSSSKATSSKSSKKGSFKSSSSKSLLASRRSGSADTTHCPFNRIVFIISSQNGTGALNEVLSKVNEINAATLGLDHLPGKVQLAALSTYKLTRDQLLTDDVITGFHVEDFGLHILVLEGLKNEGIARLWEACPRHYSQHPAIIKVFYNSSFEFSERLYGSLDVDLPKITLSRPLKEILVQPFIYLQGSIPKECLRALTCLNWLGLVDDMLSITRNGLFPSAEDISSLSLHFSLPAQIPPPTATGDDGSDIAEHQGIGQGPSRSKRSEKGLGVSIRPGAPHVVHRGRMRRVWTPLELNNPEFVAYLRKRGKLKKDFIQNNINNCEMISEMARQHNIERYGHTRSRTVPVAVTHPLTLPPLPQTAVHNYSTQTYNSSELQMQQLREKLNHKKRYTFCQEYFHRSLSPTKCDVQTKVLREPRKSEWLTSEGFNYPGVPSAKESNKPTLTPTSARLQEIAKPFEDNLLHWNKLLPTVDRMHFSAADHKLDFDLWTGPQEDPTTPGNVMKWTLKKETLAEEEEKRKKEKLEWEQKVVVDDTALHTYRANPGTELKGKAPTKTEALRSLLKDPPIKKGFRDIYPVDVPPLSVVQYPQLDPHLDMLTLQHEKEPPTGGFNPGPYEGKSLKISSNHIPCLGRGEDEVSKNTSSQNVFVGKDSVKFYWSPADCKSQSLPPSSEYHTGPNLAKESSSLQPDGRTNNIPLHMS